MDPLCAGQVTVPKDLQQQASALGILQMATWQFLQELQTGILAILLGVKHKFMLSVPSKLSWE